MKKKTHQERPMNLLVTLKLSRFINAMLPSRLVLVVYVCVCECVWACRLISADQRSSWFNHHHHHQLQLITPPLNTHHFLISFVRSLFMSPGCVWSRLRSSLLPSSFLFVFLWICHSGFVTSHQHFSSRHSSDHRKSLRHYPVSLWTAPIIISIGLIKREPTRILFPRFHHDKNVVILPLAWIVSLYIFLWMCICFCTCCEFWMLVKTFV